MCINSFFLREFKTIQRVYFEKASLLFLLCNFFGSGGLIFSIFLVLLVVLIIFLVLRVIIGSLIITRAARLDEKRVAVLLIACVINL